MEYKFSKGVKKGIYTALTVLVAFVSFAGFSDINVWSLLVQYVQPILGSMTVGALLTIAVNFVKIKWLS